MRVVLEKACCSGLCRHARLDRPQGEKLNRPVVSRTGSTCFPQLLRVEQSGPLRTRAAEDQDGGWGVLVSDPFSPIVPLKAQFHDGGLWLTSALGPSGCRSETSYVSSTDWRSATLHPMPSRAELCGTGTPRYTRARGAGGAQLVAAGTTQVT